MQRDRGDTVEEPRRDPSGGPESLPFSEAVRVWCRIAALSFGGPAGQIAVMHRILVEERRWIGEARFLNALNYCMLLPGPEAQQLAIYIGWLMHRTLGGLVAGILFVLPGLASLMALSWVYVSYGDVRWVEAAFFGLKAAVLAVVLDAVIRIGRRALRDAMSVATALAAFAAIFAFDVLFPYIIVAAGIAGYLGSRAGLVAAGTARGHHAGSGRTVTDTESLLGDTLPEHARPNRAWALRVGAILLVLWLGPVAALLVVLGPDSVFAEIAVFFSKMAVVTFGGAYAVLAYVAQEAVQTYGWVAPGEMLDGLGLAETTPGPLIMVTQFVGFLAAHRAPGDLDPLLAGTLGGLLTTWVTFTPCFLWIFLGAPFIEALRGNRALGAALSMITAAVVGVVLNLALWFSLHVLFAEVRVWRAYAMSIDVPVPATLDMTAALLTGLAIVAIFVLRLGLMPTLAGGAIAGLALRLAGW